jgi:hypothetical protein
MRAQDVVYFMFVLILVYLLVINWKGANQLLTTAAQGTIGLTKSLQGR